MLIQISLTEEATTISIIDISRLTYFVQNKVSKSFVFRHYEENKIKMQDV